MSRHINTDHVAVQVESSRTDVWVPDGLAIERRNYPADGIAFDLMNGLAVAEDTHIDDGASPDWWRIRPLTGRRLPVRFLESGEGKSSASLGPVLAQTRMPINVRPGMQVKMTGQFKVRGTGTQEKSDEGTNTDVYVRVALWGAGSWTDEYGNTTDLELPLEEDQQFLQSGTSTTTRDFTISNPRWVTVPHNIDAVYLTVSLTGGSSYVAGTYDAPSWGSALLWYFSSPKVDASTADPLRIHVREPLNEHPTYPHPLSTTGVAFRGRRVFENLTPGVEVTVMAAPDATTTATVDVYEWTGTRGPLLTSITAPPGDRVTTTLTHTGAIELDSIDTFYTESVLAPEWSTLTAEQTRLHRYDYDTVTDPVNTIGTRLVEATLGVTTVRFVDDHIDDQVAPGRRARVLGLHPGTGDGYTPLVTGTIRGRRLVRDIDHKQQVEIAIHDAWSVLGSPCPVSYDQMHEYGLMVHRAGAPVRIDDVDYTGPAGPLPDGFDYFPSFHADRQALRDALLMTRNSRKAWLFVDRAGRIQFTSTLPDNIALSVSDRPGEGISYGREIEFVSDTDNLVTTVQVGENLLDREDYVDGRHLAGSDPPYVFGQIKAKTQTIDYRRDAAVELYGESKITLPVVRGTGQWEDVRAGDFGSSFAAWAAEILDEYGTTRDLPARIYLPVAVADIRAVAALQPLDAVAIHHRDEVYVLRIREIEHEIRFGSWLATLTFTVSKDQTYWLPPAPEAVIVDGGTVTDPGPGLVDGGTPASAGTGVLDGGTEPTGPPPEPEPDYLFDNFATLGALAAPWVKTSTSAAGACTVVADGLTGPNTGSNNNRIRYVYDELVGPDQWAEIVVDETSFSTSVVLRSDNTPDGACVIAGLNAAGAATVQYVAAGSAADPVTQGYDEPYPHTPGAVMRAEVTGTTVRVFINGLLMLERPDVPATGHYTGVRVYGSAGRITSWRAGAL